jgi:transcriptional regulator with XRE-family HTH domain
MFKNIGHAIRLLRERQGLGLRELAGRAGLGVGQLSYCENGRCLPTLESLERLLRALDVAPVQFFETARLLDEGKSVP